MFIVYSEWFKIIIDSKNAFCPIVYHLIFNFLRLHVSCFPKMYALIIHIINRLKVFASKQWINLWEYIYQSYIQSIFISSSIGKEVHWTFYKCNAFDRFSCQNGKINQILIRWNSNKETWILKSTHIYEGGNGLINSI